VPPVAAQPDTKVQNPRTYAIDSGNQPRPERSKEVSDKRGASPRGSLPRQVRNALVLLAATQYPPLKQLFQPEVEKLAIECGLWPKSAPSAFYGQDLPSRRATSGCVTSELPGSSPKTPSRSYVRCRMPRPRTVAAPRSKPPRPMTFGAGGRGPEAGADDVEGPPSELPRASCRRRKCGSSLPIDHNSRQARLGEGEL
jgi:hypothetical protein